MAELIPITGVALNYRVPGGYAEILFNQGPASVSSGVREVVFVMPMLSTGTWTAATLYKVDNEKTVSDGAGPGSPLHRGIRKFLKHNKDAKVWAVPVAVTTGGSPVAADVDVTFTTDPDGTGTATVWVCGEACSYTYDSDDTVTTVAAGVKAAINDKSHLPVTADNASGVLTITAKLLGISQGTGTLGVIRVRASVTTGTAITVSPTASTFVGATTAGVEGSTTEATNFATALAVLDSVRKYYIVSSANDATSLGNLKTHIANKSEPRRGLRSTGIAAYTGTGANAATIATGRNYERLQLFWQEDSEHDCAEIAGAMAAILQKAESVDVTANINGYRLTDILLPQFDTADWPTGEEQNDAINDGVAPIATDDVGSYLVMNVNTRSKNAAGTQDDFRSTERHRVSGADAFVDQLLATWNLQFGNGKKFKDDELLSDGKFNPNQPQITNVIRPSYIVGMIKDLLDEYDSLGHIQDLAASKASVRVLKNGARAESSLDLHMIDHHSQFTLRAAEVSEG
jgi:phage tail sheath gpL-like